MQDAALPLVAVADDDEMHAEIVCAWLASLGYQVRCFVTGDALLEWAREKGEVPAAVLLDVEMPGRDGFAVCTELRRLAAFADIPCVFVSSLASATLADGMRAAGGSGAMRKDASLLPRLAAWLQHAVPVVRPDTSSRIPASVLNF